MIEESLTIKKYTYKGEDSNYIIYLIPEDHNATSFYIQREQCGLISHAIGVDLKQLGRSAESFIEENIEDWIEDCELDIEKLESE